MNERNKFEKRRLLYIGNFFVRSKSSPSYSIRLVEKLRPHCLNIISVSKHENPYVRFLDMLWAVVFQRNSYDVAIIDIFSGSSFLWGWSTTVLCNLIGRVAVVSLRGGNLFKHSLKQPRRTEMLFRHARGIVTPSNFLRDVFEKKYNLKIEYIPNGLNIERFEFRQRRRIKPTILWLRGFSVGYDPCMAVKTMKIIRQKYWDAVLAMIGPDSMDGSLEKAKNMAKEMELIDCISFSDPLPYQRIHELNNRFDIFINTTTAESFGNAVMEAAAMGMCVVTTDAGELPYLWKDGVNARVVPVGDEKEMARACLQVLEDPVLAGKLSFNGRKNAEKFEWKNIIAVYSEYLALKLLQGLT